MPLTLNGNGTISGLGDIDGHDLETNTIVNISDATFASQAVGRATLFIDESTNTVGINTTTPAAAVFLEVADGTDPIVSLNNTADGEVRLGCTAAGGYIGTESNHSLTLQTNGTARIFIDNNGETFIPSDVFIGYSKTSWLAAGATQGDINFTGTLLGNNGAGNTVLGCGVAGGEIFIGGGNTNTDKVRLQTGNTTKLIVNNVGQVGIGVETPQARSITISTPDPGSGTNYLNTDADILISSSALAGGALKFESNTAAIICGNTAGELLFQGRQQLFARVDQNGIELPNGGGINFSSSSGAGATSSLLDDYEEGSWTPSWNGYTNAFSGRYTKIGRTVTLRVIRAGSFPAGSITSGTIITGLPFTPIGIGNTSTECQYGGLLSGRANGSLNGGTAGLDIMPVYLISSNGILLFNQNSVWTSTMLPSDATGDWIMPAAWQNGSTAVYINWEFTYQTGA